MSNLSVLQLFENKTVRVDEEGLVCLTDLFKVANEKGFADGKLEPKFYFRKSNPRKSGTSGKVSEAAGEGMQFVESVAKNLKVSAAHLYKTTRGKGGGTYAHWQIALAYAKYLSHELHMRVNETYMRVQSGDVSIAVEVFERQDDPVLTEKAMLRMKSKSTRNVMVKTLYDHDVTDGKEIAKCTNVVYKQLFNGTAKELKEERGLPTKANLREHMDMLELSVTELAERLASLRIQKNNARGFDECKTHCKHAARAVASAVSDALG